MIGAICGDIIGSRFEFNGLKSKKFELFTSEDCFTDDTVITCAVAEAIMRSWEKDEWRSLEEVAKVALQDIGYWYPCAGYGRKFYDWIYKKAEPYNSCGNGSAMRVSAVGEIARSLKEAKQMAHDVTVISHDHPEGVKGAEATAVAIYLAKGGCSKEQIAEYICDKYYPDIKSVNEYHNETNGHGKEICQISVPQAFAAFMEGDSYEDVIRNCVYIGGDTDTTGAIAGGIAEAYFGVPEEIKEMGLRYLDRRLKEIVYSWEEFKKIINKYYEFGG